MDDRISVKTKSSKRVNPETCTTLDAIHNDTIRKLVNNKNNVKEYIDELAKLRQKLIESTSDIEIWRIEQRIFQLEKHIKSIESDAELMDYYLRTGDILYNYYVIYYICHWFMGYR